MISKAVRLYGKNDLRVETFNLPSPAEGELLLEVKSSAICTSCSKVTTLGVDHHRVPDDISENPIILGHEFAAKIVAVGEGTESRFAVGEACVVQPMVYDKGGEKLAVGHSFTNLGGYATYVLVPASVVKSGGVIIWDGGSYYRAALAEPLACIIAAWRSQYHTHEKSYKPIYGHKQGGRTLLLGGSGSMGYLTALLWQIRADESSSLLIYGRNQKKLNRIAEQFNSDKRISVVSESEVDFDSLLELSAGEGFDDIVVFASSEELVNLGLALLAYDGCLNMFAGPQESNFTVGVNFHAVHYKKHHIVGSSGASEEDMKTALSLLSDGLLDPSFLISHVGGIDSVPESVMQLRNLPSGKKLIYPQFDFPLTEIGAFRELAEKDPRFAEVVHCIDDNGGFWSVEAEKALLSIEN